MPKRPFTHEAAVRLLADAETAGFQPGKPLSDDDYEIVLELQERVAEADLALRAALGDDPRDVWEVRRHAEKAVQVRADGVKISEHTVSLLSGGETVFVGPTSSTDLRRLDGPADRPGFHPVLASSSTIPDFPTTAALAKD